jgi:ketosteroid isomerase-like protein
MIRWMRQVVGVVACVGALALGGLVACSRPAAAPPAGEVIGTLNRQAEAWDQAIVRKDRAAIEANMGDDFRAIDGAGTIEDKKTFVDGLMSPALKIDPYVVDDFEVRLYGDMALLSGRTRMTGTSDGKPFTSHYRYIDIYARRNDRWQIVSVQITRLPS